MPTSRVETWSYIGDIYTSLQPRFWCGQGVAFCYGVNFWPSAITNGISKNSSIGIAVTVFSSFDMNGCCRGLRCCAGSLTCRAPQFVAPTYVLPRAFGAFGRLVLVQSRISSAKARVCNPGMCSLAALWLSVKPTHLQAAMRYEFCMRRSKIWRVEGRMTVGESIVLVSDANYIWILKI